MHQTHSRNIMIISDICNYAKYDFEIERMLIFVQTKVRFVNAMEKFVMGYTQIFQIGTR